MLGRTGADPAPFSIEQVTGLRELACDRVQGFHFAWPMPADDLLALLRSAPRWLP